MSAQNLKAEKHKPSNNNFHPRQKKTPKARNANKPNSIRILNYGEIINTCFYEYQWIWFPFATNMTNDSEIPSIGKW